MRIHRPEKSVHGYELEKSHIMALIPNELVEQANRLSEEYNMSYIVYNFIYMLDTPYAKTESMSDYYIMVKRIVKTPIKKKMPMVPRDMNTERAIQRKIPTKGRELDFYSGLDTVIITEKVKRIIDLVNEITGDYHDLLLSMHDMIDTSKIPERPFLQTPRPPKDSTLESISAFRDVLARVTKDARSVKGPAMFIRQEFIPLIKPEIAKNKNKAIVMDAVATTDEFQEAVENKVNTKLGDLQNTIRASEVMIQQVVDPALKVMREWEHDCFVHEQQMHFYFKILPEALDNARILYLLKNV